MRKWFNTYMLTSELSNTQLAETVFAAPAFLIGMLIVDKLGILPKFYQTQPEEITTDQPQTDPDNPLLQSEGHSLPSGEL
jgi:hypothetical protein